jgi:hypothetical protein
MAQSTSNPFAVIIKAPVIRAPVPAWVPPSGYFADVPMTNSILDVKPSFYSNGDMEAAFAFWTGSAILRDFSPLGAQVYYGAGHENSVLNPNITQSVVLDFSTLTWSVRNLPAAPRSLQNFLDGNGFLADGTPYCTHTYNGVQEFPAAWGGAANGSVIWFCATGDWPNKAHVFDPGQRLNGHTTMVTTQPQNSQPTKISFRAHGGASAGVYPCSDIDEVRQGWWVGSMHGDADYTLFISKTGAITQYPALSGYGRSLAICNCPSLGLVIGIDGGYMSGPNASTSYRRVATLDPATGVLTAASTVGPVPALDYGYEVPAAKNYHAPANLGLQWVEELGCCVGLDMLASGGPVIVKLTPPVSNPKTGVWTWSTVPVAHWAAGDPSGSPTLRSDNPLATPNNPVYSKFRWVPSLHAFVYCTKTGAKPQVITIS